MESWEVEIKDLTPTTAEAIMGALANIRADSATDRMIGLYNYITKQDRVATKVPISELATFSAKVSRFESGALSKTFFAFSSVVNCGALTKHGPTRAAGAMVGLSTSASSQLSSGSRAATPLFDLFSYMVASATLMSCSPKVRFCPIFTCQNEHDFKL